MKRRLIYGLVIAVLAVNFFAGAWIYLGSAQAAGKNDAINPNLELLSEVLERVRTEYVDGQNLTYHDLTYAAVKGIVRLLDPHSQFMDSAAYHDLQDDTEGQFGGLGLVVTVRSNYVTVVTPMEDTPGFQRKSRINAFMPCCFNLFSAVSSSSSVLSPNCVMRI